MEGLEASPPRAIKFLICADGRTLNRLERRVRNLRPPKQRRQQGSAEKVKGNRFLNVRHGRCYANGIQRVIKAEEQDAAILENAKQAFVAGGIPKLHFVKSTEKDLDRWKRKDD